MIERSTTSINYQAWCRDPEGVPHPCLPKRDKPRRVERYFSIRPVESLRGDGQLPACEVMLAHYEDVGIPKDAEKLGVCNGMWRTVKKLHAGMRGYRNERKSESSLSSSALMARVTTKISLDGCVGVAEGAAASGGEEEERGGAVDLEKRKKGRRGHAECKWLVMGGVVAVDTGMIGKMLLIGAERRIGRR